MQHLVTPYASKCEAMAWWAGAFTDEELDWLQHKAVQADEAATVNNNGAQLNNDDIRRSLIHWLHKSAETAWVYEKLAHVVSRLNADYFQFQLTGFAEPCQLTNYVESQKGKYGWHQDFGVNVSRKLSLVLQLSHPESYAGGELQILTKSDPENVKKERGFMAIFPAWTLHQVTEVTRGSRQSLVAWVAGDPFR